jgi:hypothetical protein
MLVTLGNSSKVTYVSIIHTPKCRLIVVKLHFHKHIYTQFFRKHAIMKYFLCEDLFLVNIKTKVLNIYHYKIN